MYKSWRGGINGNDIELRIGGLRSLFLSNGNNANATMIMAHKPIIICFQHHSLLLIYPRTAYI